MSTDRVEVSGIVLCGMKRQTLILVDLYSVGDLFSDIRALPLHFYNEAKSAEAVLSSLVRAGKACFALPEMVVKIGTGKVQVPVFCE